MQVRTLEETAVDEEILVAEHLPRSVRAAYESADDSYRRVSSDIHQVISHVRSDDIPDPVFQGHGRLENIYVLAVMGESETYVGTGESHPHEFGYYMLELNVVGLEELPSCRYVVEKVPDTEVGASRCRDFCGREMLRVCKVNLTSQFTVLLTGLERHFSHGRYRGQRLSAESESKYVAEVFRCLKL